MHDCVFIQSILGPTGTGSSFGRRTLRADGSLSVRGVDATQDVGQYSCRAGRDVQAMFYLSVLSEYFIGTLLRED